ncbi:hypothetical protein HAX54_017916 [Datura stramonium]|uniref:Uncharacterized protein n=1 Tax=Datura stramonium TaxID=4076 RepID=A0ABS8RJ64_DATST|nr:hypothetical protein [Datura stramonium]
MVGFDEETEMLTEQLVTGPQELDVISIFGMPGIGKTTLAKKLYDHEAISNRFDIRLWCCSSQSYDKRALLFQLLGHTSDELDDNDLAEKLYRSLKGKRYLIVVDDVWSPEVWDDIKRPFPDDNNKSRIILTTRLESIATYAMISSNPHPLRLFTEEESWMLMKEKVFKEVNYHCPQELEEIGKKIARKCGGLPLAIVLVAGLLEKNYHKEVVVYWQEVSESLKSKMQGFMDIVESSYQHLPMHLQKCFLYFASFQEDQKVRVEKLIRLWVAENFVEASTTSTNLEMVAMDYLTDLIRSNLVMVAKTNSLGEPKAVHLHDLIHEFSLMKTKSGNFLLRMHDQLVTIFPSSKGRSGRLNIIAPACEGSFQRNMSTLRFLPSVISPLVDLDLTRSWKHLRVLDLSSVKLRKTLVDSLQYLIHLKYLELRYSDYIPYPICKLKELETFIVTGIYHKTCNPDSIWDIKSLRHLHISRLYACQLLEDLNNLKTCSDLVINSGVYYQKFMKRLPNLEKLSCRLCVSSPCKNFFPAFGSLSKLKSLKIGVSESVPAVEPYGFEDFTYPSNLKELTLVYLKLPWSKISTIGRLSNLEVVKLERNAFKGRQWDVKDGEFPKLKVLKLKNLGLSEWTASDDSYPSLKQVVVQGCRELEEIPESFGSKCTMQLIQVSSCNDSVVNAALKIKETQIEEMGNSEFKLIIKLK